MCRVARTFANLDTERYTFTEYIRIRRTFTKDAAVSKTHPKASRRSLGYGNDRHNL